MLEIEYIYSSEDSDEERPRRNFKTRINFVDLSDFQFKEYFRLNTIEVETVLNYIGNDIKHLTGKSKALVPKHQLLTTLHWLGNGCQLHGISAMHGISKSTVCRIIQRVVNAVIRRLYFNVVRWPQNNLRIAEEFFRIAGFPSVCGCIDGTLIRIDAPTENEAVYVDRHGNHSLNVMVISGPDFKFYAANANWPGSVHDSRVLRNSIVSRQFNRGFRPFPNAVILGIVYLP